MPNKVFPFIGQCRTCEIDRAFHCKRISESDLDRAVHIRVERAAQADSINPEASRRTKDETKTKTVPPSERYDLQKFEQKYRAFVAAEKNDGTLVDEVYHDEAVHMMDGVPMNKAAIKSFCLDMEAHGTKRSVRDFKVIDSSHVQSVIHVKNERMQFDAKSTMTLKEGKIYRVEKIVSARAA